MGAFFSNQSAAGLKALKPAANGLYLVWKSLHYYFLLLVVLKCLKNSRLAFLGVLCFKFLVVLFLLLSRTFNSLLPV